jgi:hypothetical protein
VGRDYYADARALGAALRDHGLPEWAQRIDAVIEAGATGTEILMGLRWTLGQLMETERALPDDLALWASRVHRQIDRALS